jgi:hypothetical protein
VTVPENSLRELQDRARELNIDGRSTMDRATLERAIATEEDKAAQPAEPEFPPVARTVTGPSVAATADESPAITPTGEVYGDDEYTLEQLLGSPHLLEPHHADVGIIAAALSAADAGRATWTIPDAQAAVDELLSRKVA